MAITASMVKELREISGAGMMDCKKALTATNGDIDEAVSFLREKGLAAAEKKAGRIAAEGLVNTVISDDQKTAAIVEVNSETDFVAKNESFQNYVAAVADQALATGATDIDAFLDEKWALDETKTVKEELSSQISVIGENMNIRRFEKVSIDSGFITSYIHAGGKIGILLKVETDVNNEAVQEMSRNIAMQIAAMAPKHIDSSEVPQEYVEQEREILKAQVMNDPSMDGKPEKIVEQIVEGRLRKELKEICLLDQSYVKDGDLTVEKYIKAVAKEESASIKLTGFVRFETGEGIEKVEEDFAEEVARQIGK